MTQHFIHSSTSNIGYIINNCHFIHSSTSNIGHIMNNYMWIEKTHLLK